MTEIPENEACYIVATFTGPFGKTQQTSARMRVSEAAMTCADLGRTWPDASLEIIRFKPS